MPTRIVLFPTDTIYGLGVDATDAEAVLQLQKLKGRDEKKPISIVVTDMAMAEEYVIVTPLAKRLAEKFLPGKLTLVLDVKGTLPLGITAGTGTVGIRVPNHPVPLRLVHELGRPISATSANVADMPTETTPEKILSQFAERSHMITDIIDEGALPESAPSTVVDARGDTALVLREGAILKVDILGA